MRFHPYQSIDTRLYTHIVRYSFFSSLLVAVLTVLLSLGIGWAGYQGEIPTFIATCAVGVLTLITLIALRLYFKSFSHNNWLLAFDSKHLLVKFASPLLSNVPPIKNDVLEIPFDDIQAIQLNRVAKTIPSMTDHRSYTEYIHYLEVTLKYEDTADLKRELQEIHRDRQGFQHYPVTVLNTRVLRVELKGKSCRTRPGYKRVMELLAIHLQVIAAAQETLDFTSLESMSEEELMDHLQQMLQAGKRIDAIKIVQHIYNVNTTEADRYISDLKP